MIWSFLQHLSSFAGVCAGLGLLVIAGLLWSHWRERRSRQDWWERHTDQLFDSAVHEWMTDRRNPLGAAADPLHFTPRSLSDKAAKGMRKAQQRIVP